MAKTTPRTSKGPKADKKHKKTSSDKTSSKTRTLTVEQPKSSTKKTTSKARKAKTSPPKEPPVEQPTAEKSSRKTRKTSKKSKVKKIRRPSSLAKFRSFKQFKWPAAGKLRMKVSPIMFGKDFTHQATNILFRESGGVSLRSTSSRGRFVKTSPQSSRTFFSTRYVAPRYEH